MVINASSWDHSLSTHSGVKTATVRALSLIPRSMFKTLLPPP